MEGYLLALDQGTTSSRAILFDHDGRERGKAQVAFRQIYPKPGWVEHDPAEIWDTQLCAARGAMQAAGASAREIVAIGIANQRETAVFWDRGSGAPVGPAIVWQDRRTAELCRRMEQDGLGPLVTERTGLLLDPYFSASKISWLLASDASLRRKAEQGELAFGTVDSWLIYRLTGSHLTDPSNASRTMLFDIHKGAWDAELCRAFGVPPSMLPAVQPSASRFGTSRAEILGGPVAVCGDVGDQQAALLGQRCLEPGSVKATYGTGCFCLLHTGRQPSASAHRLLTTVAWDLGDGLEYALEGSVFIAGAVVQWLRDELGIIATSADSEQAARSVPDSGGVCFVPAFAGLGAPWWDPAARGAILGLTRGTRREHVVRAALESIAFQVVDLVEAMAADARRPIAEVRVDGGASMNALLMQVQADLLGLPLVRPASPESTALGAAFAAGLGSGFWTDRCELREACRAEETRFTPSLRPAERAHLMEKWHRAVAAARAFGS